MNIRSLVQFLTSPGRSLSTVVRDAIRAELLSRPAVGEPGGSLPAPAPEAPSQGEGRRDVEVLQDRLHRIEQELASRNADLAARAAVGDHSAVLRHDDTIEAIRDVHQSIASDWRKVAGELQQRSELVEREIVRIGTDIVVLRSEARGGAPMPSGVEDGSDRRSIPADAAQLSGQTSLDHLSRRLDDLTQLISALRGKVDAATADFAFLPDRSANAVYDVVSHRMLSLDNAGAHLLHKIEEVELRSEQHFSETLNALRHLTTDLAARSNRSIDLTLHQIHEVVARLMAQEAKASPPAAIETAQVAPTAKTPKSFAAYVSQAERDFPSAFPAWHERLVAMQEAFDVGRDGNAANERDLASRAFADFVSLHAKGALLDIGPGVFGAPYYLKDFPLAQVAGIEPLPIPQTTPFPIVQGIGEYLPWPDASFTTVVSATSLDHCVDLDKSLSEMRRVLAPDGHVLLWIGNNPGSPAFQPDAEDFEPADKFHLFHFDTQWFEPKLERDFVIEDKIELLNQDWGHIFYRLSPRGAAEPVHV